jgi:hypothetical protein
MMAFFITMPISRTMPIRPMMSYAEHQVDDDDRRGNEIRFVRKRRLEGRSRPFERGPHGLRQSDLCFDVAQMRNRRAERVAG